MRSKRSRRLWSSLIVGVVLLGVAVLAVVLVNGGGDDDPSDIVSITVNTRPGDGFPTKTIDVPAPLAEQVADVVESDLRTPSADTPPQQLERAQDQRDLIRETQEPLPTAGASAGFKGCVTRFVRNQSGRGGVRPQVQVLHYTVSLNRPGWDDVNAIVAYFDRSSSQASSHFVIDREGNCAYIVPIEAKAWTQADGNPIAISYEIINSGSEATFMDTAGYSKLRKVVRQVSVRTGIPMRRGAIAGCASSATGIVQHADGGICWGGHHDIGPFSLDAVTELLMAAVSHLTKPERDLADARCARRRAVVASAAGTTERRTALDASRVAREAVRAQMRRLAEAKQRDGQPWSYRHRGARRHELAGVWQGTGCS